MLVTSKDVEDAYLFKVSSIINLNFSVVPNPENFKNIPSQK